MRRTGPGPVFQVFPGQTPYDRAGVSLLPARHSAPLLVVDVSIVSDRMWAMKESPIAGFHSGSGPGTRTTSARLSARARQQATRVAEVAAMSGRVRIENSTTTVEVPAQLAAILRVVAEAAAAGETITLLVGDEGLTSQQVADILNVSRPHVVKLARDGVLPHKMVGNRHRFSATDVARYEREEAKRRDRALSRIAHTEEYTSEDF